MVLVSTSVTRAYAPWFFVMDSIMPQFVQRLVILGNLGSKGFQMSA